jgi:myo-inositol-1(or 4)-monophosphatase
MLKTTLLNAVEAGADELRRYFNNEDLKISNKEGINNWVTEADHASEKAIIDVIHRDFPSHFILSEEVGEIAADSDTKWIIDPIDGTINFASGIPLCAVSIGIEKNGEMIMGAVYNPFINELFFAEKGKGAFLNDKKISVSKKRELMHSCLVTGF